MNSIMGLEKLKSSMLERKLTMTTVTLMGLNIPMTMFRQRFQGLRKDQPVYLCDANGIASYRAARILKRMDIQISIC